MPPAFALSQDQTLRFITLEAFASSPTNRSRLSFQEFTTPLTGYGRNLTSVSVTHKREHIDRHAHSELKPRRSNKIPIQPNHPSKPRSHPPLTQKTARTPPTYPFLAYANVKERRGSSPFQPARTMGPSGEAPSSPPLTHVSTRLRRTSQVFAKWPNRLERQRYNPLNRL